MNYTQLVNRNPCLRGGVDEGGTAAADLRQWERDVLSDDNCMVIAETVGIHPDDARRVLELALCLQGPFAPWMAYAGGSSIRPTTPKPRWLKLNYER